MTRESGVVRRGSDEGEWVVRRGSGEGEWGGGEGDKTLDIF